MQRKVLALAVVAALGVGGGWLLAGNKAQDEGGVLVHVVLFELNDDASATAQEQIDAGYELLADIESVRSMHSGTHCAESSVANVEDYDFALVATFDDAAGLQEYIDHEYHQAYLRRYAETWANVRVVDFTAR